MLPAASSPLPAPCCVLVTGARGFIGKHLVEAMNRRPDTRVIAYDLGTPPEVLEQALREADVIYHLAGVNRPQNVEEFQAGNADFTGTLCSRLLELRTPASTPCSTLSAPISGLPAPTSGLPVPRSLPLLVLSSSIQAAQDHPYGRSKRQAEQAVEAYALRAAQFQAPRSPLQASASPPSLAPSSPLPAPCSIIFRLKNVFGKWCRPNYNSVTATFCHNIAHDLPITISDPTKELELVYIDDVIAAFLSVLNPLPASASAIPSPLDVRSSVLNVESLSAPTPRSSLPAPCSFLSVPRSFQVTLGELASRIRSFRDSRNTLVLPSFADEFTRCLYATYLSYLDGPDFAYSLDLKTDNRGCLAEFMKSPAFGQIFVSRTKPGITRGNHYHHTKTEKFLVLEGEAIIRFRPILGAESGAGSAEPEARSQAPASAPRSEFQAPCSKLPPSPSGSPLPVSLDVRSSQLEVECLPAASRLPAPCSPLISHRISGRDFRVVDIPPGYTHSIENIGTTELVTLFWASEIFDPTHPDTYALPVQ